MAIGARSYKPLDGTLGDGVVVLAGSFAPNGSSAPNTVKGKGFTVAYTAAGRYTITLDQQYKALLAGVASVQISTANNVDMYAQLGSADVTTAKTIIIRTMTGGTETNMSADPTNKVHFCFWLSRSSLNT